MWQDGIWFIPPVVTESARAAPADVALRAAANRELRRSIAWAAIIAVALTAQLTLGPTFLLNLWLVPLALYPVMLVARAVAYVRNPHRQIQRSVRFE